jgi:hypothetical protein
MQMDGKISDGSKRKYEKWFSIFIFIVITGIAFLAFIKVSKTKADFYNELWGPASLLLQGKSPYDTTSLKPELPAVWLPMAVGVFSPVGFFSEQVAIKIWLFFNLLELGALVWFITKNSQPAYLLPLVGILAYFFPPTIHHFVLGQFSITAMSCCLISIFFAERHFDWPAAIFLALGLAKPQLGILAVFGLGIFYYQRGGLKHTIVLGLQVLLAAFILSLPLFVAHPEWIPDWIASMKVNNYAWRHPSIFFILRQILGIWGYIVWGLTAAVVLLICYQIWIQMPPLIAMPWSLGLTTVITPYIWSWDFVLLLPLWIYTFTQVDWRRKIFLIVVYMIVWGGMAVIQLSDNNNNVRFWWVPALVLTGIAIASYFPARHSGQGHKARR